MRERKQLGTLQDGVRQALVLFKRWTRKVVERFQQLSPLVCILD